MKTILLFFFLITLSSSAEAQKALFENESLFVGCKLDIPLTYKKKHRSVIVERAKELYDEELVLLSVLSTGVKYYQKCYLRSDGEFSYLVSPEDAFSEPSNAVFVSYNEKNNAFYTSNCFEAILAENPELKKEFEEGPLL